MTRRSATHAAAITTDVGYEVHHQWQDSCVESPDSAATCGSNERYSTPSCFPLVIWTDTAMQGKHQRRCPRTHWCKVDVGDEVSSRASSPVIRTRCLRSLNSMHRPRGAAKVGCRAPSGGHVGSGLLEQGLHLL